jgi:FHS family L-fucose permease-like MFS transporter
MNIYNFLTSYRKYMSETAKKRIPILILVSFFFFNCGFSSVLNDILVPYLKEKHSLSYRSAILVQTSYYIAYAIASVLGGFFLRYRSSLWGMRCGLCMGAIGAFFVCIANSLLSYSMILLGIFILGSGIALLQVVSNPYILRLGEAKTAASRLSFSQSLTSVGGILSSYFGSKYILSSLDRISEFFNPIEDTYLFLSFTWASLFLLTFLIRFPKEKKTSPTLGKKTSVLKNPYILMGIAGILIAVGVETSVGSFLVSFLNGSKLKGVSMESLGKISTLYWVGFLLGRIIGGFALQKMKPSSCLLYLSLAGVFFAGLVTISSGYLAVFSVLILGLCTSMLYPLILALALSSCTERTSEVSGFLCMGNIGGALIPYIQGFYADVFGIRESFLIPVFCFILLLSYALVLKQEKLLNFQTKKLTT